jgi:hypothetical protein
MRILPLALGMALIVHAATVHAATAFGSFSVQVVVIGTCHIDAARLLPQLATTATSQVCAQAGASAIVTLDRRGRRLLVEF